MSDNLGEETKEPKEENMGLLSRTLSFRKRKQDRGAKGGLLSRALEYADAREQEVSQGSIEAEETSEEREETEPSDRKGMGLLERALAVGPSVQERGTTEGLLERASSFIAPQETPDTLLKKATPAAGEATAEAEEKAAMEEAIEPAGEVSEEAPAGFPTGLPEGERELGGGGLLARADRMQAAEITQKAVVREEDRGFEKEELTEREPAALSREEAPTAEGFPLEKPLEEEAEEKAKPPEEKPSEAPAKTASELLNEYTQKRDSIQILQFFDDVVHAKGYTVFISELSEELLRQGRGKSVLLYLPQGERYTVEHFFPGETELKKIARKSVKKSSRIAEYFSSLGEPVRSTSLKEDNLRRDAALFDPIEPWMALPLCEGEELFGFFIIGNQPKKPRLDTEGLALLARLSTVYLARYRMEQSHAQHMEKAKEEHESHERTMELFRMISRSDVSLKTALEEMCGKLGIESAVLVTGWETRGKLSVQHSVGMTEKLIKSYKISKNDKEIRSILKTHLPGVPKDVKSRVERLSSDKTQLIKTFVVAPVLFGEELLGALIVHRVKGSGLKVSRAVLEKIAHGTMSLIPYFLDMQIKTADPFGTISSFLEEQIEMARRKRQQLHFILFALEREKKAAAEDFPSTLDELALKVKDLLRAYADAVKRIDLTRTLLVAPELEDVEANEIIKGVMKEFQRHLGRKKHEGDFSLRTLILRFPKECRNAREILYRAYRSV